MKRLTKNEHWDSGYKTAMSSLRAKLTTLSRYSFYYYDFIRNIEPYIKTLKGGRIIEIGCAPGNHLLLLAERYNLTPYGIEYAEHGVKLTRENFRRRGYNPGNVLHADFFDKQFHKKHRQKYDVVVSFGFIEHFDDVRNVLSLHSNLLKKNGLLIITVPNFTGLNKLLSRKETLDRHNLEIMSIEGMKNVVPENLEVKKLKYFGGIFNTGLFSFENKLVEAGRLVLFGIQRLIMDPLMIVASEAGIKLECRKSSPSLLLVAVKSN